LAYGLLQLIVGVVFEAADYWHVFFVSDDHFRVIVAADHCCVVVTDYFRGVCCS